MTSDFFGFRQTIDALVNCKLAFQVIILDTRYHRDPMFSDGTILGTTQWSWLEKEMRGPATEITIIVSSIQVF